MKFDENVLIPSHCAVCHDTLAWVLGTGAFLPVSILWIFQMSLYTYPASRLSAIGLV